MPHAPLTAQKSPVRTARYKRSGRPFLRVEQFVLIANRIAKPNQFLDAAQLAECGISNLEFHALGPKLVDRCEIFQPTSRLPADIAQPIDFTGMKRKAMTPIVKLEIERCRIRLDFGRLKPHDLGAVGAPFIDLGRLET